ncbi:MAG: DNA-binding transcriptional regulator [Planctomycetaceae bacterium]|nr:DNA-binding transcriptional regulator [Planctomycetaceae bacterium]
MNRLQIAVIVETINSYGRGLVLGICRFLQAHPETTIYFEERTLDSPPPTWLKHWRGDGIIVRDRSGESCRLALGTNARVVDLGEHRRSGVPTIYSDYESSAILAANHLKERGFMHFGFVGMKGRPFSERRKSAFIREVGECSVFDFQENSGTFSSWGTDDKELIAWLMQLPKPVGVMASFNLAGVRVLQACQLAKISVPNHVALIGVSNDDIQCLMSNPPMTSVIENPERIGFEATALLFRLVHGEKPPAEPLRIPPVGIAHRRSTDIWVIPDTISLQAMQWIRHHVCEKISTLEIAEKLHVSRRTLERRFQKHVGHSIHQEIVNAKLTLSCQLLSTTKLPLRTIAKRIGFDSLSHFASLFHKNIGTSPNEYRKSRDTLGTDVAPTHLEEISGYF